MPRTVEPLVQAPWKAPVDAPNAVRTAIGRLRSVINSVTRARYTVHVASRSGPHPYGGRLRNSHVLTPFSSSHSVPKPLRTRKSEFHKEVHCMISNQRGASAPEAPSGVTWGGVPFHARRAMTVAAATLVVAGLAGPTAASAATTTRPRRPTRCRSSSASPTVPVTAPSGRCRHSAVPSGVSSPSSAASPPRCRPTGSTRSAPCGRRVGHPGRRARSAEHGRRVVRPLRPARSTRWPTR